MQATIHGVTKSRARLSDFTFFFLSLWNLPPKYMHAGKVRVLELGAAQWAGQSSSFRAQRKIDGVGQTRK